MLDILTGFQCTGWPHPCPSQMFNVQVGHIHVTVRCSMYRLATPMFQSDVQCTGWPYPCSSQMFNIQVGHTHVPVSFQGTCWPHPCSSQMFNVQVGHTHVPVRCSMYRLAIPMFQSDVQCTGWPHLCPSQMQHFVHQAL